eukprot:TRINITY_DN7436_c0_g1_i2.p1 TRINITY_DN7436_c0_g1~~TRINITY_DN7436_c0_g1_i2.p1  ORF type:complete len:221 (+),score=38.83 TRINITY_DN7436_c0_g1_i2:270-932(+)
MADIVRQIRSRQARRLMSRDGKAMQFMKDEFKATIKSLTEELEQLKAENKDLRHKLVMSHSSTSYAPSEQIQQHVETLKAENQELTKHCHFQHESLSLLQLDYADLEQAYQELVKSHEEATLLLRDTQEHALTLKRSLRHAQQAHTQTQSTHEQRKAMFKQALASFGEKQTNGMRGHRRKPRRSVSDGYLQRNTRTFTKSMALNSHDLKALQSLGGSKSK